MSAMYKLKAYFGMVPAEELAEYADEPERYAPAVRRTVRDYAAEQDSEGPDRDGGGRWDDRYAGDDDRYEAEPAREHRSARAAVAERPVERVPSTIGARSATAAPIRGALAIDPDAVRVAEPAVRSEQRERPVGAAAFAKITTLQPTSYNEARTIGERYRDGIPVIMNLTELDDASAKRLVDFAAGLVFALRGGFDKVTNRVFLLTPADVEVSADDARKLVSRVGSVGTDRSRY